MFVIFFVTVIWMIYVFTAGYGTVKTAREIGVAAYNDEESGILIESASYSTTIMLFSGICLIAFLKPSQPTIVLPV